MRLRRGAEQLTGTSTSSIERQRTKQLNGVFQISSAKLDSLCIILARSRWHEVLPVIVSCIRHRAA